MSDPILSTAVCATLETTVNSILTYDPGTRAALAQLQGQVLAIVCSAPSFRLYLQPCNKNIRVMAHYEGDVTTELRGSLSALTRLAMSPQTSLANAGVTVTGSTSLLIEMQKLLAQVDIDWEEAISQVLGDVAGHQAASTMRSFQHWLKNRAASNRRLLSEFLTEELKSVPTQAELQHFYQEVDELQLASDRLHARFNQLRAQLNAQLSPSCHNYCEAE